MNRARLALSILRHKPALLLYHMRGAFLSITRSPPSPLLRTRNGVTFEFDFELDPVIKRMYYGTYELLVIDAIRRHLRAGDIFLDVGANVGYISAVAAGIVGVTGEVHSFEPVPTYYNSLQKFRDLNPRLTLIANNVALGEYDGSAPIAITNQKNIGWNTMVPHFMEHATIEQIVTVEVRTLDGYVEERGLSRVAFIKIDTEGYELPVLKGASEALRKHRPKILCEVAPAAFPRIGAELSTLENYMESLGYRAYDLVCESREVALNTLSKTTNVLFLHDCSKSSS